MQNAILDGLSLVDTTGRLILGSTVTVLVLGIGANLFLRSRYARLRRDLERTPDRDAQFDHPVLQRIVRDADAMARAGREVSTQAIVEERFEADLGGWLLAERFVKGATGLVIILGLLGTFYGLTSSIGRLVALVSVDPTAVADVTQSVTTGLSHALSGMAVAFSNSLLGIGSAVVLTALGIVSNVTDQRTGAMVQAETYLDRRVAASSGPGADAARLEAAAVRFEAALQALSASTGDFREFNAHLRDNVQRMSLSFGDLSEALKTHAASVTPRSGR
ncbi:MAG TPA: hypothetical protein VGG39_19505 [Polyangiaceae bacterium]|jgi:hypothetical protein